MSEKQKAILKKEYLKELEKGIEEVLKCK